MDERTDAVSAGESTEEIRRDIARTQNEMSHTIDEIQYRLSPAHLKEQAKQRIRRAGVRTSRNTIDRVKSNPLGAAMVGVGLWMLLRNNDDDHDVYYTNRGYEFDRGYDYDRDHDHHMHAYSPQSDYRDFSYGEDRGRMAEMKDRVGESLSGVKDRVSGLTDRVGNATENVGEHVGDLAGRAGERASELRDRTMYGARQLSMRGRDMLTDTPLIAGIAALALGALVGAMIPETERENELFGQKRDQLKDRATEIAREGVDHAKHIASAAATAAKETAQREASNAKEEMKEELSR